MAKIILVTGGNRGIGLEICRQLAEAGHTVILGARKTTQGLKASKNFEGNIDVQPLDVISEQSIEQVADYVNKQYGKLDVLINNAGIGVGNQGAVEANLEEVMDIMETNFYGPWRMSQAFIPLLEKSEDGRIINMSSGMGELHSLASGGFAGYRLSKTALNGLTIQLAGELAETNIKVNAMCPGWVRTDMGGSGAPRHVSKGADTAVWLATEKKIPSGKFFRDRSVITW